MSTQYIAYSSRAGSGGVTSINTLTGAITLSAGTGIAITPSGNTLTISTTALLAAITSINSDTTAAQTLSVGTAGTNFAIVDAGGGSHVFNLPTASASNRGALQSSDFTNFQSAFTATNAATAVNTPNTLVLRDGSGNFAAGTITASLTGAASLNVLSTAVGAANGVASLDSGGHIPLSQLPSSLVEYKGTWAASTNTPTLANGTGVAGWFYIASDGGTVNFGAGNITFNAGDWVLYDGSIWERAVQSNVVQSVNGQTGVVVINAINQLTGDGTTSAASGSQSLALTLATVNGNVGSFGSASSVSAITVNAKGLVTAAASTSIQIAESQVTNLVSDLAGKQPTGNYLTALTGDATASGPGSAALTLATVNGNVGSFTYASITVNAKGLITSASSGTAPLTPQVASYTAVTTGTGVPNNSDTSPNSSYATWTKISDTNNDFSASGGFWTCPATGDYLATWTAGWNGNGTGYRTVSITQAGSAAVVVNNGIAASSAGFVNAPSVNFTFHCVAGDTLAPSMYQNSGGTLTLQSASGYTFFSVQRVK